MDTPEPAVSAPPKVGVESPYRGLLPYSKEDAAYYAGRDEDCRIVCDNILGSRLTVIYGGSGVGKSSLLQAGVLAAFVADAGRNDLRDAHERRFIPTVFSAWRNHPANSLCLQIKDSAKNIYGLELGAPEQDASLSETLARWSVEHGVSYLILLDQFEDLFLYHGVKAAAVADEIVSLHLVPDFRAHLLISVREDELAGLDVFAPRVPNILGGLIEIRHLDDAAAEEAIRKPLRTYNRQHGLIGSEAYEIEDVAVDEIVSELKKKDYLSRYVGRGSANAETEQRIEAPYLQLILTRLWKKEVENSSRVLRRNTFSGAPPEGLGESGTIVDSHLDQELRALRTDSERDLASQVFLHMVTASGRTISQTVHDLSVYTKTAPDKVFDLLCTLSAQTARVLRPLGSPGGAKDEVGSAQFEIFHDVLAGAVLDWRARHEHKREVLAAEEQERVRSEKAREAARLENETARAKHWRWLALAGVLAIVALAAVAWDLHAKRDRVLAGLAKAIDERDKVKADSQARLEQASLGVQDILKKADARQRDTEKKQQETERKQKETEAKQKETEAKLDAVLRREQRQEALRQIERDEDKARAAVRDGKLSAAITLFDKVLTDTKRYGTPWQLATSSRNAGQALMDYRGDDEDDAESKTKPPSAQEHAVRYLRQAFEVGANTHPPLWQTEVGLLLQKAYARNREYEAAQKTYRQTVALAQKINARDLEQQAHIARLDMARGSAIEDSALEGTYRRLLELKADTPDALTWYRLMLAYTLSNRGDPARALDLFREVRQDIQKLRKAPEADGPTTPRRPPRYVGGRIIPILPVQEADTSWGAAEQLRKLGRPLDAIEELTPNFAPSAPVTRYITSHRLAAELLVENNQPDKAVPHANAAVDRLFKVNTIALRSPSYREEIKRLEKLAEQLADAGLTERLRKVSARLNPPSE